MPFNQQIRILTRDDVSISNPRPDPRPNNIPDIKYGMSDIVHIFVPRLIPSIEPNLYLPNLGQSDYPLIKLNLMMIKI